MEKLIAQGNRLLFSTSYGYLEPAERVAKRHPDVIIMQGWRPSSLKTSAVMLSICMSLSILWEWSRQNDQNKQRGNNMQPSHPHDSAKCQRSCPRCAFGHLKVKVHVVWTNSWSDPPTEAEATKGLIESGADIIGSELSGPLTVARTADQQHVMTIGNQTDLSTIAPGKWLTGAKWNFGPTFCQIVKSVRDHTFNPGLSWFGMSDGTVVLSSFGKVVPKTLQTQAIALAESLQKGKQKVFSGPLKDREGKLHLSPGQTADSQFFSSMDWFVPGVEGSLPRK